MAKKILFEIEVENVGAARRIEALREEIKRLNKEIKGVNEGMDEYRKLTGEVAKSQIEIKELKEHQKQLNREFQAAKFPKDSLQGLRIEYAKLTDQIKILSAAERQSQFGKSLIANAAGVKKEIDAIEQSIGRFTGNVGNYRSAFQGLNTVLLSLGAGFGFSEAIQQNTLLSDSIANVAKTTGLTIKQAEELAEVLKFRDTRTSLADQLKITEIGGQLGIATDQLQSFTEGVDVLNVALGDQFGNVDILTREFAGIRNVLTDFKTDDAADDILKLGNAVNYLEAQGNATGQSIVDFVGRIAGAGVPLGATTDKIIGLSTTLSELSINPERGATAVARLLTELAKAPDVFAKAIGEPADQFTKLVQTDIVGALALVSEKVAGSSETNTAFATTLDELGIGAQGAIEVFGKLGGSTDLLRTRIAQAGETLQNTDSITREFEVKNNNAAAAVEKLRNAITGALTGTDAQEAIADIAGSLTDMIGVLGDTYEFLKDNELVAIEFAAALIYLNRQGILAAIPLLRTLGVSLGFLVVNEAGAITATNTLTTAQGRAAISAGVQATATRALALAQSAIPFVAVIAATYALVQAWDAYQDSASASEKAARAVADAQKELAEESAKEISALQRNIGVLRAEGVSKETRKKAIEELTKSYPEYLKGIDLEKAGTSDLITLQDTLTKSIFRTGIARKQAAADEKLVSEIIENQIEIDRLRTEGLTKTQSVLRGIGKVVGGGFATGLETTAAGEADRLEQVNKKLEEQRKITEDRFERIKPQEFVLAIPPDGAKKTKELGDEAETAGKKIAGLSSSSKGAKDEINEQAGSVGALREQISKLQKQIDATNPDSPALSSLVKRLDETKKKLKEAEQALLASTFKSLFGREIAAPTISDNQPDLAVVPELAFEPDAKDKLIEDALAAKRAVQDALGVIQFPVEVAELSDAEKKFNAEREKAQEEIATDRREKEQKAFEERQALEELAKDNAISSAQTISDSTFEIQRNRLQQETDAKLAQLDLETQGLIAAAKGDEQKIKAIEKDAAIKRAAIEKEAARQRKAIAVKEAIINTALAITKALTGAPPPANLILAGVAAAAGAAQLAVINSQEFAGGGVVKRDNNRRQKGDVLIAVSEFADGGLVEKIVRFSRNDVTEGIEQFAAGGSIKRLRSGIIREPQNAPRTPGGDTVLAYLSPGEMVLNERQQDTLRSLYGQDAFALAGVPGESTTRRRSLPGFASGGVVGIVPQNGFASQVSGPPVSVEVTSEFSEAHIQALGEKMGAIIGQLVEKGAFNGTLFGNDEANRMAERIAVLQQSRQG